MAKIRPWLSRWPRGRAPGYVEYSTDGTIVPERAVVTKDGGGLVSEAGADPSNILGINAVGSADTLFSQKVLVAEATDSATFGSQAERDPVSGDVGKEYGIAKDGDGVWHVDTTETVKTRVEIVDVDTSRNLWFWKVLTANQQA